LCTVIDADKILRSRSIRKKCVILNQLEIIDSCSHFINLLGGGEGEGELVIMLINV